ncbi:uncharacterized protein LOC135172557 isoform X1 [Diachasmimorpha longicaudata]|uniref:uncharacterized protein LOC135172557 isoform X1 n=1 Tax=Diachasmimorpha longicaudata TaxID=58733 RepID=UPI0030B8ADE5
MSVLNQSGEDAVECPLCMEPLEVDDLNFFPCTCGYQICRFCWHRIRTDENGLCPACRKAYSENPADFKPLSKEEISRLKAEKRLKDQQRKQRVTENRKHLANVRVVQKNLVFVVGLPMRLADADVLKRHEYFGKFGKIHKVVINQSTSYAGSQGPSASAYVTYQRQEDALRAIEAVNNIQVDARTIKTSLGTTKYCSHFMRNQACPKPDCMYLHDLGDQEASFTKEEMHQGKHQEYERKLVQSLHVSATLAVSRKPTPSPPVTGTTIRENGAVQNSQTKEAWPSLQPGQTNSTSSISKDSSPPSQSPPQANGSAASAGIPSTQPNNNPTQQQNNNNKGEGIGSTSRRGKSNSESKVQAVRNKHKNTQNKEKHGTTRTTSRSESSSSGHGIASDKHQIDGQKDIRSFNDEPSSDGSANGRCNDDQGVHRQRQNSDSTTSIEPTMRDIKLNGITRNGETSESESEPQREGSTPASTASSSSDDCGSNGPERLIAHDDNCDVSVLGTSPIANTNASLASVSQAPPGLHPINTNSNGLQTLVNHQSLFQTDNNSFFSSNTFQKISTVSSMPQNSQSANPSVDWTTPALSSIPDSLPAVHSTEDWQAAFGFQPEKRQSNHQASLVPPQSPTASPSVPFSADNFLDDEDYLDPQYSKLSDYDPSIIITSTPASKFMADFQQNSLQQRLSLQAQQNQENCEYIKQNGHMLDKQESNDVKADDDLGFDPFHETQKALAELMENEMQLQQQRILQQQQQQQNHHNHRHNHYFHNHQQQQPQQSQQQMHREREETSRNHQNIAQSLQPQHFTQVTHLAHLHQAHQLQVIQQSHNLISRLPQSMIAAGNQSPGQPSMSVTSIGQRSRLPPPGFPGSTPNHMNSFGLGIPRPAPNNSAPQQNSYLPNGNVIAPQAIHKCTGDGGYGIKDWCEINGGQQGPGHVFSHQGLGQKGWNNFGPVADWTSIDPAIVSSSRPVPFQGTSTWQFPRIHPSSHVPHNAQQQEQSAPAQHWAMQPPPGFGGPSSTQLNGQQSSTAAQPHSKLISAGPEIENL